MHAMKLLTFLGWFIDWEHEETEISELMHTIKLLISHLIYRLGSWRNRNQWVCPEGWMYHWILSGSPQARVEESEAGCQGILSPDQQAAPNGGGMDDAVDQPLSTAVLSQVYAHGAGWGHGQAVQAASAIQVCKGWVVGATQAGALLHNSLWNLWRGSPFTDVFFCGTMHQITNQITKQINKFFKILYVLWVRVF